MGLVTNNKAQTINTPVPTQLNTKELEYILLLIKRSMHSGEDLETVYGLIIKLQEQYKELTKK
jgi:hypothetical protein